jgi:hypothetical protein
MERREYNFFFKKKKASPGLTLEAEVSRISSMILDAELSRPETHSQKRV